MKPTHSSARRRRLLPTLFTLAVLSAGAAAFGAEKKVLLIAGPPSHGPGFHEHNAGVLLMQKGLAGVRGLKTSVALNGWPASDTAFEGVDAVVLYCDGGGRHLALADNRLAKLDALLARGVGLGLIHYAVEPTIPKGQKEFLDWVGGAFEVNWSVNPHWVAEFKSLPRHPITRGVRPFSLKDEWYFHMRFVESMKGVTPLLMATPPAEAMSRPDGLHSGNPAARAAVAAGKPQTVSWAYDRANGGRGFGFTGAHYHENWGNEDFRRFVFNAVLWLAKMEVPANGVQSQFTAEELRANLDPKPVRPKAK